MFDVIVVGAGVNGSSTAYHLIKQNLNVLLIEQFPTPHTRGSSHGQTRVTRCLYYDEILGLMSRDSFPKWRELEKEVGEQLLIQNGYLEVFNETGEADVNFKKSCEVLDAVGAEYQVISGEDVNNRFPPLKFPSSWRAIHEPGGGTLLASKCVGAFQRAFLKRGGTFKDGESVEEIVPGNAVTVRTTKGKYEGKSLVITAGTFTSKLTTSLGLNLPLQVKQVYPCYWRVENSSVGTLKSGFPSWFSNFVYGFPVLEYPGLMKICGHWGKAMSDEYNEVGSEYIAPIESFIKTYMTKIATKPSVVEECFYTCTPDNMFIIDVHPLYKNIAIGAGFSGGGFKMSPVTGSILGDLALGKTVDYDISTFRMSRFSNVTSTKSRL